MAAPLEKTRHRGIYRRGSRYVIRYRVNGQQRQEAARTLEEALRMKRARETDRDRGEFEAESRIPFREYATEWIERYQGNGRRGFTEGTRDDYRGDLEAYAVPYLDERLGRTVSSLSPWDIANWIGWLCDSEQQGKRRDERRKLQADQVGKPSPKSGGRLELSDATVRRIVSPVRACHSTAKREGLILHNPADGAALPVRAQIEESEPVGFLTRVSVGDPSRSTAEGAPLDVQGPRCHRYPLVRARSASVGRPETEWRRANLERQTSAREEAAERRAAQVQSAEVQVRSAHDSAGSRGWP